MKKIDMNLLERYKQEQKRKSNQTSPVKVYLAILVITILFIGTFAVKLFLDNISIENKILSITDYVESPLINEKIDRINTIQANLVRLDTISEQLDSLTKVLKYKPRFDSKALDIIFYEKPTIIKFAMISYDANSIKMKIIGTRPSDPSNYVLRLQRTQSFEDVSYSGYNFDKETKLYYADIICVLKGGN